MRAVSGQRSEVREGEYKLHNGRVPLALPVRWPEENFSTGKASGTLAERGICNSEFGLTTSQGFPSNHQFPIPNPSRSGISLLEVLISIFILSIGLVGVAALIPIGKVSLAETAKSDRTGACGRAALREIKVRRILDSNGWTGSPTGVFVIDPLGIANGLGGSLGPITRIGLTWATPALAEQVFRWNDDLAFSTPSGTGRPQAIGTAEGNCSWFLTLAPAVSEMAVAQKRLYTVSVVVCHKRIFTGGEQTISLPAGAVPLVAYGGMSVSFAGAYPLKDNDWILLCGYDWAGQVVRASWFRVANVGYDSATGVTALNLVGPDWVDPSGGNFASSIVIVDSVSGVYSATLQLDADGIWTR